MIHVGAEKRESRAGALVEHCKRHIGKLNWKVKPQQSQTNSSYGEGNVMQKVRNEKRLTARLQSSNCFHTVMGEVRIWNIVTVERGLGVWLDCCSESINTGFIYTLISSWVKLQMGKTHVKVNKININAFDV